MSDAESRTLKRWMAAIAAAQLVVSGGLGVLAGGRVGRAEASTETRAVARDVVREEWLTRLEAETKRIASEAAAERAVREAVTPIAIDVARADVRDAERREGLHGRGTRTEERLEQAPAPAPRRR